MRIERKHIVAPLLFALVPGAQAGESAGPQRTPVVYSVEDVRDVVIDRFAVMYAASDIGVRRFDLRSGQELPQLELPGGIPTTLDLDSAGCRLAIGDRARHGVWVLDSLADSDPRFVSFPFGYPFEGFGSFSVIWESPGTVLSTPLFVGWGTLRRTAVDSGNTTALDEITDNSMLAMSANRSHWAMVEAGISSGPVHLFNATSGVRLDEKFTQWFNFEVAIAPHGELVAVPTSDGTFLYDVVAGELVERPTRLGTYASNYPVGMAFSPHTTASFAAWHGPGPAGGSGLYLFGDYGLTAPQRIDSPAFDAAGNEALEQGRLRLSADGRLLAATLRDQVLVYDVAEWSADPDQVFADGVECDAWR